MFLPKRDIVNKSSKKSGVEGHNQEETKVKAALKDNKGEKEAEEEKVDEGKK